MVAQRLLLPLIAVALWLVVPSYGYKVTAISPTKLPDFFERCSIKDPNLEKCCADAGNKVFPHVVKGYAPLGLPSLDPVEVDEIQIDTGSGPSSLKVNARNIVITGLETATVSEIKIDMDNLIYTPICFVKRLQITAEYEIDGRILLLPIKGSGTANFTFENSTMVYIQPFRVVKKPNGKYYQQFPSSQGKFTTNNARFHLSNLFNGDKVLGEQINLFLNENWRQVMADVADPFIDAAIQVIHQFAVKFSVAIPFDEVFLEVDDNIQEAVFKKSESLRNSVHKRSIFSVRNT